MFHGNSSPTALLCNVDINVSELGNSPAISVRALLLLPLQYFYAFAFVVQLLTFMHDGLMLSCQMPVITDRLRCCAELERQYKQHMEIALRFILCRQGRYSVEVAIFTA